MTSTAKASTQEAEVATPKDSINGVTRPKSGTMTGRVWEIADAQSAKAKTPAPRKTVLEECTQEGINPATAATQYGRWRKYHGLGRDTTAVKDPAKPEQKPSEDSGVE